MRSSPRPGRGAPALRLGTTVLSDPEELPAVDAPLPHSSTTRELGLLLVPLPCIILKPSKILGDPPPAPRARGVGPPWRWAAQPSLTDSADGGLDASVDLPSEHGWGSQAGHEGQCPGLSRPGTTPALPEKQFLVSPPRMGWKQTSPGELGAGTTPPQPLTSWRFAGAPGRRKRRLELPMLAPGSPGARSCHWDQSSSL